MNELTRLERRLVDGLEAYVGPRHGVDSAAVTRAAVTRAAGRGSPLDRVGTFRTWWTSRRAELGSRPLVAALVVLAVVTTLVVGGLGAAALLNRQPAPGPVPPVAPTTPAGPSPTTPSPAPSPTPAATPGPATVDRTAPFVVFLRRSTAKPNGFVPLDLWAARLDGSGEQLLANDAQVFEPVWLPDGRRLMVHDISGDRIYVADVGTTIGPLVDSGLRTHSATACKGEAGRPSACQDDTFSFAPDGRSVAFKRSCTWQLPGCSSVAILDLGTGRVSVLKSTTGPGRRVIGQIGWSPDGARIVFSRDHDLMLPGSDIYVVDRDGRNLDLLNPRISATAPAWSPDGSAIAFVSETEGADGQPSRSDIYTTVVDGSGARRLTADGGSSQPEWTPDGRIRFWRDGRFWIMDADGGHMAEVPGWSAPSHTVSTSLPSSGFQIQPSPAP